MGKAIFKMVLLVLIFALAEVGYTQEMDALSKSCRVKYAEMLKFDIAHAQNTFEAFYTESEYATAEEDKKAGLYTPLSIVWNFNPCCLKKEAIVRTKKENHRDTEKNTERKKIKGI